MNLVDRAKNMVLAPKSEWDIVTNESTSTAQLFREYIVPLAAIGPIASFIGLSMVGISLPFIGTYRVPLLSGLSSSIVSFVFSLVGIYLLALIINALAPTFSGQKDMMQALKLAAYSMTPAWIASVLHILPSLSVLVVLASLYSLYLLYLGLPVLMKSSADKTVGYTVITVVCAIVMTVVLGAVTNAVSGIGGYPGARPPAMSQNTSSMLHGSIAAAAFTGARN